MISEVRTHATVQPGGLVEVRSNELPEGATVEVIVLVEIHNLEKPSSKEAKAKGLSRFLGATKGKGSFSGVADIDAYIRQERDSWDS
jgi:hypothetical protein